MKPTFYLEIKLFFSRKIFIAPNNFLWFINQFLFSEFDCFKSKNNFTFSLLHSPILVAESVFLCRHLTHQLKQTLITDCFFHLKCSRKCSCEIILPFLYFPIVNEKCIIMMRSVFCAL